MKKLTGALATLVLTATISSTAFAAMPYQGQHTPNDPAQHQHFKQNNCNLKNLIKDSLQKNNRDLKKVKADVDKYHTDRLLQREIHLAKIAKEKGISSEQLKAQITQKRQARLERKAKEAGLSTEELKKIMKAKHQQRLETMAKELGLSMEQLQTILPAKPMIKL